MKLPIPDDWNGTDWCRFSICWPDSLQWRNLLRGFVTYSERGRAWDEKTGIIKDVQAVGKQIHANNLPLEEVILSCKDADQLIKTNLILIAALTGQTLDLSSIDLDSYLSGFFDYTSKGVANRLGPEVPQGNENTISGQLSNLYSGMAIIDNRINNLRSIALAAMVGVAALTGQTIDLSDVPDLVDYLSQEWDYTSTGLANRLGPEVSQDSDNTIQATLERINTAVESVQTTIEGGASTTGEDLEDDLAKVWKSLDDINTVLGGDISDPPEPL